MVHLILMSVFGGLLHSRSTILRTPENSHTHLSLKNTLNTAKKHCSADVLQTTIVRIRVQTPVDRRAVHQGTFQSFPRRILRLKFTFQFFASCPLPNSALGQLEVSVLLCTSQSGEQNLFVVDKYDHSKIYRIPRAI